MSRREDVTIHRRVNFEEYVVDVRIAIRASNEFEAHELISRAVLERIDGHLLAAQRQARVLSVDPESEIAHEAYELAAENLGKLIDRRKFYGEYMYPNYVLGGSDHAVDPER